MGQTTGIEWADHTFNPWSGCTKVNAGCTNCYAEVNYSVKMRGVKWGPHGNRVKASDAMWREPIKWNRRPQSHRPRVFCASLADVFEDWQGPIVDHRGAPIANTEPVDGGGTRRSIPRRCRRPGAAA